MLSLKKRSKILSLTLIIMFSFGGLLVAQKSSEPKKDTFKENPDGTYSDSSLSEDERPDDSYLAKFHARDIVEKLVKINLERIYLLKVVVSNFSGNGWKGDYDKIYAGYKKAMDAYYKRNLIYARKYFEDNRVSISILMEKVAKKYRSETQALLDQCTTKILKLDLDSSTRSDPNKSRELKLNQMRLKIAYGQYDDARRAMFFSNNFDAAIYHYRVGKQYGIKILEDLAGEIGDDVKKSEAAYKSTKDKYKVHKADNLNRIFNKKKK